MAFFMCPRCGNPIAQKEEGDSEQEDEYYCKLCSWSYGTWGDKEHLPNKARLKEARKIAKVIKLIDNEKLNNKGYFDTLILNIEDVIENEPKSVKSYRDFSKRVLEVIFHL